MKLFALYVLLLASTCGSAYGLWYEHEEIVGLQTQITEQSKHESGFEAKQRRFDLITAKNMETFNSNFKEVAKYINEIMSVLNPEPDNKSSKL